VKISVDGELIYSFAGSADKYTILASNAKVNGPQVLQSSSNQETGEGYLPQSDYMIYLGLGLGAVLVLIVVMLVVRR